MNNIFKKATVNWKSIINDYLISAKLETIKVNPFYVTELLRRLKLLHWSLFTLVYIISF